jgi:phage tail-like protein
MSSPQGQSFREFLLSSRFYIDLQLIGSHRETDAIFLDCKGIKATQQVIEVTEVTHKRWGMARHGKVETTKIPGNTKINNIVLRRCCSASDAFWDWFRFVEDYNWGWNRKDGFLKIKDQSGTVRAAFYFDRAWPTRYSLSEANARSSEFLIEEMELAVESFTRLSVMSAVMDTAMGKSDGLNAALNSVLPI